MEKYPEHIIISERSILSDSLFAEMMYKEGNITRMEYQIYRKQYDYFLSMLPTIDVVYLRCDPVECKRRARKGEEEISLQYLRELHKQHERWNMSHILIFDANVEIGFIVLITSWCLSDNNYRNLPYLHNIPMFSFF